MPIFCDPNISNVCPEGLFCLCPSNAECQCLPCTPRKEHCNQKDDDCDGNVDEEVDPDGNVDMDGDGFGRCRSGDARVADCDDSNPLIHPGLPESCNGIDDNCNQQVDEGLTQDSDGDGYAACQDGKAFDCNDSNSGIHPGAIERCNGQDDDCDPITSEINTCPEGQVCAIPRGGGEPSCASPLDCRFFPCPKGSTCDETNNRCVGLDCRRSMNCNRGERCDPTTGACILPRRDGEPCHRDIECESKRCYPRGVFRANVGTPDSPGICARPCCSDSDCAEGFYCAASTSGLRACLPGTRSMPSACSHSRECPSGQGCVLQSNLIFRCAPPPGNGGRATLCDRNETCRSGLCATAFGLIFHPYCLLPCGSAGDCPDAPGRPWACMPLVISTPSSRSQVQVCLPVIGRELRASGEMCGDDAHCREGYCASLIDESGATGGRYCSGTCCSDRNCPRGFLCTPVYRRERSQWEMRCIVEPQWMMGR
ncbi:MAG: putative metal-binding motif-containing protein [Sandaracinaceae bacterium]|nr:putative metal-binding motif-containing protein [Sandaracinaceae bacterium]